jgi:hypothetical protein
MRAASLRAEARRRLAQGLYPQARRAIVRAQALCRTEPGWALQNLLEILNSHVDRHECNADGG